MAKRFTSTEIWSEDWFLDIPAEYKLFWYYMLSACNHAGIFKVNVRTFCGLNGVNIDPKQALMYFNAGKERVSEVSNTQWLIVDFFVFQYGAVLNPKNRVHESILKEYKKQGISLEKIRGLDRSKLDLKDSLKDKDKDKDIDKGEYVGTLEGSVEDEPQEQAGEWQDGVFTAANRGKHCPNFGAVCFTVSHLKGTHEQAIAFFNHYESVGWMKNGHPIVNWQPMVSNWLTKDAEKKKTEKVVKLPAHNHQYTRLDFNSDQEYQSYLKTGRA